MSTESNPSIDRKKDHIELSMASNMQSLSADSRFDYDPIHSVHPDLNGNMSWPFLGKQLQFPIWISSMTGGTQFAKEINQNLARACKDFGLAMGLGSCRKIIDHPEVLPDFQVRKAIGDQILYANLGIAQIEQWIKENKIAYLYDIVHRLEADGLIIHINPLQEWMQPEGDRIQVAPIETIKRVLDKYSFPIIVKEVGQGMSKSALSALLQLPLAAIEFGAYGGTNFALLELMRVQPELKNTYEPFIYIGHTAEDMVQSVNELCNELKSISCQQIIISGGIRHFLDGFYYISKCNLPAIYGQASAFLKPAQMGYDILYEFVERQTQGLLLANSFLKLKNKI